MGPIRGARVLRASLPWLFPFRRSTPDSTLLLLYPPFCIFQVSLESGLVLNFDSRTLSSFADLKNPLASTPAKFTLAAHEGAASSLDVSPHVRGCLATGGTDKLVKVWNIDEEDTSRRQVSMVTSRDVGVVRPSLLPFFSIRPSVILIPFPSCLT